MRAEQMNNIRTLYGKDSKGGLKVWAVQAVGSQVLVSHGKLGGKMQLKVTECKGKNIGRANETTPEVQAQREAESKYKKQLDKLYRPTIDDVEKVGNKLPMLAHDYTKVGHRFNYPCHVSPKLDGVRCLATLGNGSVEFTSRGGKTYMVPNHLYSALMDYMPEEGELVLDGELYFHGMELNQIVSAVKNKDNPMHNEMQFHVFDVPSDKPWSERYYDLIDIVENDYVKIVPCVVAEDEDQAREWLQVYMGRGFEGLMLRAFDASYQFNHRSSGLMKWKEFQDTEARIESIDVDKLDEAVFNCVLPNGVTFKCKIRGDHSSRKYSLHKNTSEGLWLNVRYQQLTEFGVPQFPVATAFRDCDKYGNPVE